MDAHTLVNNEDIVKIRFVLSARSYDMCHSKNPLNRTKDLYRLENGPLSSSRK